MPAPIADRAQHTPGPWLVDGATVYALNADGQNRFTTNVQPGFDDDFNRTGPAELAANARLIAAAPDLLAAAETVLAGLHARLDAANEAGEPLPVFSGIAALHDAICKASA